MDTITFLNKVIAARADWDAWLARVPIAKMEQPGVSGIMSLKDVLAHLTWYDREMVLVMQTRDFSGSDLWNLPLDQRNSVILEANQNLSLDKILVEAQNVYQLLIIEIEKLNDIDLLDPASYKGMPAEWIPWQVIASNTYEHYREHLTDLQTWVNRNPSA